MPTSPTFHGKALVLGDNDLADSLVARLRQSGVPVDHLKSPALSTLDAQLQELWQSGVSLHVFLTTAHDADANWAADDPIGFRRRREPGLQVPYRLCQLWMQRVIDAEQMDDATLVTVVRGGGRLGISPLDGSPDQVSLETGSMSGLTKAMSIEAWVRGYRDTPMLVIDPARDQSPNEIVDGVWRELAVPSYDEEVVVSPDGRTVVSGRHTPLPSGAGSQHPGNTRYPLTPGGVWVVAGGGRGITAMTAMALAERHDLSLHLLGMAPTPNIDAETRDHAIRDRADLRRVTMRRVQAAGDNPVKHWRQMEKAIEIDLTLRECERRGIQATYHSVDISDSDAVENALEIIRRTDGPIRGVIQGAGSGQDARFDRKRPDKVDQCLSAKIDGTVALAHATRQDPLEWFVGFGSISGRFGANGHTDYSAANDMLAKLIGGLGRRRPTTRCVTFHWHAWGDIGMATKPEAKLALDMIGMNFMPATEGLEHFLNELERGGDASEVLITDRRYIRKFFQGGEDEVPFSAPMLLPNRRGDAETPIAHTSEFTVTLDPTHDRFLNQHLVSGTPTLPMAMAVELIAEAAQIDSGRPVTALTEVRAIAPLKVPGDDAFAVELFHAPDQPSRWTLACDLRRRDGRLVQSRRPHFEAIAAHQQTTADDWTHSPENGRRLQIDMNWVEYLPPEAPVFHGQELRCLRKIGFTHDPAGSGAPLAVGTIVAPSPSHLAGDHRPLSGWITSPATVDAMLYAAGMLAGSVAARPSLPISIGRMDLGRLPLPGERVHVTARWLGELEGGRGGRLSVLAVGDNDQLIARLGDYRIGWLAS
ncbi:KR domain-containing protein [Roseiconus nitratireducens]|uniref:KR domain-containing protein n=1 Tax=Roseiconus nitratireducens TaxID=2605748 RepID=A0A5M6DL46_9BACT|nr:SDR family oxidoreductase [Roseiconus nitratireducens]KAA5546972.1 KR domain-containing protein [Roseiconus nitratireducens]